MNTTNEIMQAADLYAYRGPMGREQRDKLHRIVQRLAANRDELYDSLQQDRALLEYRGKVVRELQNALAHIATEVGKGGSASSMYERVISIIRAARATND